MSTTLNPYLTFDGNARQAMEFYSGVLGGNLDISNFGDSGMPHDPAMAENVMHAMLVTDDGMTLMASDNQPGMEFNPGNTISVSLSGDDEARLTQCFEGLAADGTIIEPLMKAPWGDTFGMLIDQFGICWLVNIAGAPA